eukprot:Sspe_Gene.25955::Locus_10577_Transcript_1_1_Confidence_1.000_Length_813::g.25955::m.25955
MGSPSAGGPADRFSTSRKLYEVKGVYGAPVRLPSKLPALPATSPSRGDEFDAASQLSATTSTTTGTRLRYTYGDVVHPDTLSNRVKREHREAEEAREEETARRQRRESLLRKKRLGDIPSQFMSVHQHDLPETQEARALLQEIEVWTRKLNNCQAELTHRKKEYEHVLAGGDPYTELDEEFDSDEEKIYPTEAELVGGQELSNGMPDPARCCGAEQLT